MIICGREEGDAGRIPGIKKKNLLNVGTHFSTSQMIYLEVIILSYRTKSKIFNLRGCKIIFFFRYNIF